MLPKLWMFRRSYKFPYHDIVIGHRNGKDIFYILSMEAVPLTGSYDLLIGSITAFCSETDRPKGKNIFAAAIVFICMTISAAMPKVFP